MVANNPMRPLHPGEILREEIAREAMPAEREAA
jgi:plasmid maintenance system antidote protein VapI